MAVKEGKKRRQLPGAILNTASPSQHPEFDEALGDFIIRFSMIEGITVYVLASLSSVDRNTLKAIVYPLRIDNAISVMKRVIIAKKLRGKKITELLETLSQLSKINKFRNDILHLGAFYDERSVSHVVSNKSIAFDRSIRRRSSITSSTLKRISHDLNIIVLLWLSFTGIEEHKKDREYYIAAKMIRKKIPLGMPIPWIYKPQSPKGRANKTPRKRRVPKRQPQSS